MCSSLFPDSPEFLREKVVHKNPIDVMEDKVVRLVMYWNSLMKVEELAV